MEFVKLPIWDFALIWIVIKIVVLIIMQARQIICVLNHSLKINIPIKVIFGAQELFIMSFFMEDCHGYRQMKRYYLKIKIKKDLGRIIQTVPVYFPPNIHVSEMSK